MADAYGSSVQGWRTHLKAWVSKQTDTACTIICDTYIQTLGSETFTASATGSAKIASSETSGTATFSSTQGVVQDHLVASMEVTVERTLKAQTRTCKGAVKVAGNVHPGSSETSISLTVPAIQHKAPRNVKGLVLSDTRTLEYDKPPVYTEYLSWTNDSTPDTGLYPYAGIRIYRADDNGGRSVLVTLDADATSYVDTFSGYGRAYTYTVVPYNDAGEASGVTTSTVYMEPEKIDDLTVTRVSDTSLRFNFTPKSNWATDYHFFAMTVDSEGYWGEFAPVWDGEGWLWDSAPTELIKARVRGALDSEDANGEWSDWLEIPATCDPGAPATDYTDAAAVYPTNTALTFSWTPNHPDFSPVAESQVQISVDGKSSTYTVSGTATAYAYKCATNGTVSFSVRTKSAVNGSYGPWSTAKSFLVATPPAVSFTAPAKDGDEVHGLPLTLKWSVTDSTGVSAQALTVSKTAGGTVYSATPATSARSQSLSTSSGVVNGTGYTAAITVRGGSGLSVTAKRAFRAKWTGPDAPTVETKVDSGNYRVSIKATAATTGDVQTDHLAVTRTYSDANGNQHTLDLLSYMTSGSTVLDKLPPLNTPITYTVTAVATETGATTVVTRIVTVESGGYEVYSFRDDAGLPLALGLSASSSESIERTGETFDLAGTYSGDGLMEFVADGGLTASGTHSYNVLTEAEYEEARRLARLYPVAWYRSAWGDIQRCHVKFSLSYDADSYSLWGVSVTTEELTWKDPV